MPKWLIIFTAYVKIPLICKGPAVLSKHLHSPTHTIKPRDQLVVTKAAVVMNNMQAGRQESSAQYALNVWTSKYRPRKRSLDLLARSAADCGQERYLSQQCARLAHLGIGWSLSDQFHTAIYTFSNLPNTVTRSRNPRPTNLSTTNINTRKGLFRWSDGCN